MIMDDRYMVGLISALLIIVGIQFASIWSIIYFIGLTRLLIFAYSALSFCHRHFIRKQLNLAERYGKGSWIFVTGAANGIGLEFCLQLSKFGFNIIMADVDEVGLIKAKELILETNSCTEVETIVTDLSKLSTVESVSRIIDKVSDKDISILINNAAIGDRNLFLEESKSKIHDIIQVNMISLSMFTSLLFKKLQNREKKSAIINMASVLSYTPTVTSRVYCMTKAFVLYFTKSIYYESSNKIDILAVCPGNVSTKLTGFVNTCDAIKPITCVKGILKDLGQSSETNTHWLHEIIFSFIQNTWYINSELTNIIYNELNKSEKEGFNKMNDKN